MTLIIGSEGSMGKRYQAILKHLGFDFSCYDIKNDQNVRFQDYQSFIVATPTITHSSWVEFLDEYKRPILCEKPFDKRMSVVEKMLSGKSPVNIMMQYYYLANRNDPGKSYYNYFRHGNDGLVWDCFQIIALASGDVELREDSPIWKCHINGCPIYIEDMDGAYIEAVRSWLNGYHFEPKQILDWHKKVKAFEEKWNLKQSQS